MAAEGGPAVDLRDESTVRAAFFHMLVDWHGTDLVNVYEPFTDQFGYLYSAWLLILFFGIAFGLYKKWNRKRKDTPLPYKVIKPPLNLTSNPSGKRVVAVVGATGFVGSQIVKNLIENGNYIVYMIGRRFTEAKIHPKADAVFQVDMMNYDALISVFNGVDSVIHAAAAVPNVSISNDDIWRVNVVGSENVLSAAQKCGVKSLVFVSGLKITGEIENKAAKMFYNSLIQAEQTIISADGKNGLHTCVLGFGHIYGLNAFHESILKGKLTHFPLSQHQAQCIPVWYAADAAIKAEQKLTDNFELLCGKYVPVTGSTCTFKELFTIRQWGVEIKDMSMKILKFMANFNVMVGTVTGYAPFGGDLCPAICSFFDLDIEEFDSENVLGLADVPSIEDGVAKLRKEFEEIK